MTSTPTLPLRDGGAIPVLGFGTWLLEGATAYQPVRDAIEIGYRHIDTATGYDNEQHVGRAIADSGIARDELFVTTKLPPDHAGRETRTIDESLRYLGLDYVDLWLIHWPVNGTAAPEVWKQLIAARDAGKARAIGVSNYSIAQIDELIDATGVTPAVNQIPWSPRDHDEKRVAHARDNNIVLEGYSGLKRSNLDDRTLVAVAEAHGVTVPQVIIRWHIEHDIVVIPKSAQRERIASNFAALDFTLTPDEVSRIDALAV
ncbi:MAG: aldo/keto reductase [Frankiales bacterium]|nr:aldo/keto reductase [Frankiales bacterium]